MVAKICVDLPKTSLSKFTGAYKHHPPGRKFRSASLRRIAAGPAEAAEAHLTARGRDREEAGGEERKGPPASHANLSRNPKRVHIRMCKALVTTCGGLVVNLAKPVVASRCLS